MSVLLSVDHPSYGMLSLDFFFQVTFKVVPGNNNCLLILKYYFRKCIIVTLKCVAMCNHYNIL